jgi:cadmium resistance protein CadD (predicted permease)
MLLAAIIAMGLLGIFTICIGITLLVIARDGDERRRMMVDKAVATMLKLVVVVQVLLSVIHLLQGQNIPTMNDANTFSMLTIVAFFFVIGLWHITVANVKREKWEPRLIRQGSHYFNLAAASVPTTRKIGAYRKNQTYKPRSIQL